jgi:hypothetical protein
MNTDVKKLIDIAKGEGQVKWTEGELSSGDVSAFCKEYNITGGKDKVHGLFLEALYQTWTNKPSKSKSFHKTLKKLIPHPEPETLKYDIDLEALTININEINKLIGPFLLKRASEEIKKKKERSIKTLRSS